MSIQQREYIDGIFGEKATLIQAADFGWVQRARLYWGLVASVHAAKHASCAHAQWEYFAPGQLIPNLAVLRWAGKKHPPQWSPTPGERWLGGQVESSLSVPVPGSDWQATYAGGRFMTLATCFPRRADRGTDAGDVEQRLRFEHDGKRFPLSAYTAENCVQRDGVLRVLNAEERESLMGYPQGWTAHLRTHACSEEDTRCHEIGCGVHLPSIMLLLTVLFHLPHAACSQTIAGVEWSSTHIPGSAFDVSANHLNTHATTPEALVADIISMLPK